MLCSCLMVTCLPDMKMSDKKVCMTPDYMPDMCGNQAIQAETAQETVAHAALSAPPWPSQQASKLHSACLSDQLQTQQSRLQPS